MGISKIIKKFCKQKAVYWGSPANDGYGGFTYATAVEIDVRWEDAIRNLTHPMGEEVFSKATVLVQQDVDLHGYLFLGTLADLNAMTGITLTNPKTIDTAFEIIAFDKVPDIKARQYVRTVYLGFRNLL
jgi:hypothetical protein